MEPPNKYLLPNGQKQPSWEKRLQQWLYSLGRDLLIVSKEVWVSVALYASLLLLSALLLWVCVNCNECSFFELLAAAFHLTHFQHVPESLSCGLTGVLAFVLPILSIFILGSGALNVVAIFLNRRQRREEWDPMVAKTFSDHTVICGLGELGRAICDKILQLNPSPQIVLVDVRPAIQSEIGLGDLPNVCQVRGDMTSRTTLESANCPKAKKVIITSGNDGVNLETAFKVEKLNPGADIWVRLYRRGLVDVIGDKAKTNIHFFWPYERAAENVVAHMEPCPGRKTP